MQGSIEITTTIPCILMCSYCPQAALIKNYGRKDNHMSFETFKICIDKVPLDVHVDFSGYAECFLNREASKMMRYAYDTGHRLRLYTTLKGITKEDVDIIKGIQFDEIVLHLPDNDNIMKANVDDDYINNLIYFKSNIAYTKAHSKGPLHQKLKPHISCTEEKIEPKYVHSRANNIDPEKVKINVVSEPYRAGKIACGVIVRHGENKLGRNVLLPNGSIQLCCMTYSLEHPIGNLLTDSYEDLFKSEEYKRVIQGMNGDESIKLACRTCREVVSA